MEINENFILLVKVNGTLRKLSTNYATTKSFIFKNMTSVLSKVL